MMARATDKGGVNPLPDDLPFDQEAEQPRHLAEHKAGSKIRVGFVGSGFNSKAVLYLSQDMFRFFDKDKFEIHIFSVGPADNPLFIEHGRRGVDWRQRVINNVGEDCFHDIQHMKLDHIKMARFIKKQDFIESPVLKSADQICLFYPSPKVLWEKKILKHTPTEN